jgi:hypothetical protein
MEDLALIVNSMSICNCNHISIQPMLFDTLKMQKKIESRRNK